MGDTTASQRVGSKADPLTVLFKVACESGGESTATGGTNVSAALHSSGLELLRITSERQWRSFTDSLASEGLIVEVAEQCQLQELWDRAVAGANAFGRRGDPSISLAEVHHCVDKMYNDDVSIDIACKITYARESVSELEALLEAWNIHSFNPTQIRQALLVLHGLEESHCRSISGLEKEQDRQDVAFTTESVLRLMGGADKSQHGRRVQRNPLLWQANNAGLVDQRVAKARVAAIRYPGRHNNTTKNLNHASGVADDDPWGLCQGLAGSEGVHCRRGFANRNDEEVPVTVIVMPKAGTGHPTREKLWRGFLAHRQLAAGGCVMHSLGVADRDPEETLFYYEHVKARPLTVLLARRRLKEGDLLFRHWARCALMCMAQLSEESTFTLETRVTMSNLNVGAQGLVVRLGGLRWGPEVQGVGQATEASLLLKDSDLCLGLANILEGLLGGFPGEKKSRMGNVSDEPGIAPSPMLVNILACLRLPPRSREGITLKGLLGHQYFTPLQGTTAESAVPTAWRAFIDQEVALA